MTQPILIPIYQVIISQISDRLFSKTAQFAIRWLAPQELKKLMLMDKELLDKKEVAFETEIGCFKAIL